MILGQLPPDAARAIAYGNAARLHGRSIGRARLRDEMEAKN
jgi:hypothetical protein